MSTRAKRRGKPRDLAGLSAGNPFADSSELGGEYDDSHAGYTDLRRRVPPTDLMKVPHRVSVWPATVRQEARAWA